MIERDEVLQTIAAVADQTGAAVFAGNGYNARALCAVADRPANFYMLGSMGLCPALAAGFAHHAAIPVIAVEGDGNALMGLSGLPLLPVMKAEQAIVHVVLDNQCYESTGGQASLSGRVNFQELARGAGYELVGAPTTSAGLRKLLETSIAARTVAFLHLVTGGDAHCPPARVPYLPHQIMKRFLAAVPATRPAGHNGEEVEA
jgi:sulfopyruvate decarboxylase subunit beta